MRQLSVALLLCSIGCSSNNLNNGTDGGDGDLAMAPADLAHAPYGDPIPKLPKGVWTWVDFPDSACDDGTPTGVGVSVGEGPNLLVFLMGGGACWDYQTCFQLNIAQHGPYGKTQFDAQSAQLAAGTIYDRDEAKNPFKDWTYVFVPYCTGDVHAGDNVIEYTSNQGDKKTMHHVGHANMEAFVKRIAATVPTPLKVVLAGSSAGGFGASFNYPMVRSYWPGAKGYLLDDSGPALEEDDIPPSFRDAWFANWRIDKLLDPICPGCRANLALALKYLIDAYPNDRLALLSSLQDKTIRSYMLLSGIGFQHALERVQMDYLDPSKNYRYFFVDGDSHTMLGAVGNFTSQGVALWDWMTQMVSDDPAWKSLRP